METNKTNLIKEIENKDIPMIVSKTLSQIKEIDDKVDKLLGNAHEALEKAKRAKGKKANWSITGRNKQEAIEALQEATDANANAISSSYDASLELFKNQKSMSNSIRDLFVLGVSNLEANRITIKQLEESLKDASSGELNEYAREELKNIIRQLRAQRDVWLCIEKFEKSKKVLDEVGREVNELKQLCNKKHLLELLNEEFSNIETKVNEVEFLINKQIRTIQIELEKYSDEINKVSLKNNNQIKEKFEELNANIEQKLEEQKSNIREQILVQEARIEEYRKEIEDKLSRELLGVQDKYIANEDFEILLRRYQILENKVYEKSFFDSIWYKGAIGIIALAALAISIFTAF